jgi:hypothetical protein
MVITDRVTAVGLFGLFISLVVSGWLYRKISVGRNWARITFLAFFVLGNALMLLVFRYSNQQLRWLSIEQAAHLALQAVVLYLLFSKPGSEWFRRTAG